MIYEEYILEIGKQSRYFNIAYRNGLLVKCEFFEGSKLDKDKTAWFWNWIPRTTEQLSTVIKKQGVKIIPKPQDLSFFVFWEAYKYKVGKKGRAERLWEALDTGEKILCLNKIPRYLFWLNTKNNMEQLYPETFLSQRRWENEFKV